MTYIEKPKRVLNGYQPLANVLQEALDQAQAGKGSQRHANGKPFLEQPIITDGRACGPAGPAFQARKKILEALNCPNEERAVQDLLGAIVYTAAMVILKREEANHGTELWGAAISEQEAQVRAQVATSAQAKDTARDAMATSIRYAAPKLDFRGDDPNFGIIAIDGKGEPFSGGHVVCSACGLKCSIGSEQEQSVNLTGRCTICRDEKERETYTVPPLQDTRRREQAATSAQRRGAMDALASACGYTIPPLQDGDDDPVVHIVPDRTSRSGEVDASDWRPCPND